MKIYAAPMAGVTDYSFRKILEKFEPDYLLYANFLIREDEITVYVLLKCVDIE